jgi:hypothetical protein
MEKKKRFFMWMTLKSFKKFEGLEPSTVFYAIEYYTRDQEYNIYVGQETWSNGRMVMEKNGKFYKLNFYFDQGVEPIDLNGDGIYEWIVTTPCRNDDSDYLFASKNGQYGKIASLEYCELRFYSDPGDPESGKKVYKNPSDSGDCKFRNNKGVLEAKFGEKSILLDYDGEKLTIRP